MSDTPRTDAACGWPWGQHGRIESSDLKCSPDGPFVHSSVARKLEHENAALREQNESLIRQRNDASKLYFTAQQVEIPALLRENAALREALNNAIPILEQNAEDERSFYGSEDKYGVANEAEAILKQTIYAVRKEEQS